MELKLPIKKFMQHCASSRTTSSIRLRGRDSDAAPDAEVGDDDDDDLDTVLARKSYGITMIAAGGSREKQPR